MIIKALESIVITKSFNFASSKEVTSFPGKLDLDLSNELTGAMDSRIVSNAGGQVFILEFISDEKIYAELANKVGGRKKRSSANGT